MKLLFPVLCSLLVLQMHSVPQERVGYKPDLPLIPLKDKRSDVENIAKPIEFKPYEEVFEVGNQRLHITFAKEPCIWHGWNVEPGTVISYDSYPKQKVRFEQLNIALGNFSKTGDDILTQYFTDSAHGIQYVVGDDGLLSYIRHTPSDSSAPQRCSGFPRYNAATERYSVFQEFGITGDDEVDIAAAGGLLIELKKSASKFGTVFVYTRPGNEKEFKRLSEMYEKYAFEIHMVPKDQLFVIYGGFRDKSEVETYLVPKNFPAPTARPKYPSNWKVSM